MDRFGFLRVGAAIPRVRVADCAHNVARMEALVQQAAGRGVEIVVFPELAVTGYTCGDLFLQPALLRAAEEALQRLIERTRRLPVAVIAGVPLILHDKCYNTAAVFAKGRLLGVVPKSYIPNYSEFYEARWFASGSDADEEGISFCGQECDFGTGLTFAVNGAEFGVEICEDLWTPVPPSTHAALSGAKVLFNLSASPETVGKQSYLQALVAQQSARNVAGYVYCSAGFGESSTDLVFAGNAFIAENGTMLRCSERFSLEEQLVVADIDIERLATERLRRNTFRNDAAPASEGNVIEIEIPEPLRDERLERPVDPHPFVPADNAGRDARCEEIFHIQSAGLMQRLDHTRCRKAVIGLSGGLDSTLALLVTVRAFDALGLDRKGIIGITMPGFGTTGRTHGNALTLMQELGITSREISIHKACEQHFADIGLNPSDRSTTYENAQARERTQILMDVANLEGGLVIGTGDLSELALGWATYNGDHMSMYGVNCSVPKTLVRHLVAWAAEHIYDGEIRRTLLDVVDTPVSPELLPAEADGTIAQKTEELVGPYELHDFFLYHFIRHGAAPAKLLRLAEEAFGDSYDRTTVCRWMREFFRRFFAQQFKRSALPDGPKVGTVSLSPRGDWRMPSDAQATLWLAEVDALSEGIE